MVKLECLHCGATFNSYEITDGIGKTLIEEHHYEGDTCPECLDGVLSFV